MIVSCAQYSPASCMTHLSDLLQQTVRNTTVELESALAGYGCGGFFCVPIYVVVLLTTWLLWLFFQHLLNCFRWDVPPGSLGLPIIGEMNKEWYQDSYAFLVDRVERYGKVFKTHLNGVPTVVVCDLQSVHALLQRPDVVRYNVPALALSADILSKEFSMFTLDEGSMKRVRKDCRGWMAALRKDPEANSAMESNYADMLECISRECTKAKKAIPIQPTIDYYEYKSNLRTILGVEDTTLADGFIEDIKILREFVGTGLWTGLSPSHTGLSRFLRALKLESLVTKSRMFSRLFLARFVEARRRLNSRIVKIINEIEQGSTDYVPSCLVAYLSQECTKMEYSVDFVCELAVYMIIMSQLSLTAWMPRYLQDSPSVLASLQKQLPTTAADRSIRWDDTETSISTRKFVRKVVLDALRIQAGVPLIYRTTTEDFTLPNGNTIPKNWNVILLIKHIQHGTAYFEDPQSLCPASASRDNLKMCTGTPFLPFSYGPRSCIGMEVGIEKAISFTSLLVQNYSWDCESESIRTMESALQTNRPSSGMLTHLRRRTPVPA
jgi:cytochrome P450